MENEENVEANGDDDIDHFEGDDVEMNEDEIEMDSNTNDSGTNKSFCIYELISIVTRSLSDKQRQEKSQAFILQPLIYVEPSSLCNIAMQLPVLPRHFPIPYCLICIHQNLQ